MENKLKGGKADKMTPKKIAKKFDIEVKDVKKQIEYGTCVECEHTEDKEKAKEIATDHVSEFPDYYNRLDKMEKEAEKHWNKKEKKNESKIFIKKLLRENISEMSNIPLEVQQELQKLGVNPKDVYVMIDNEIQNEGLGDVVKKSFDKFKTYAQAVAKPLIVCSILATGVACNKHQQYVYKFSYHIDKLVVYTLKQDAVVGNNLKLDAGQQFGIMGGVVYMNNSKLSENIQKTIFDFINDNQELFTNNSKQQYNPQEQVGSWYELEDHQLSEPEREVMEDELAAQEKVRITGKDYIMTDEYKLEYMGPSKRGDIETK